MKSWSCIGTSINFVLRNVKFHVQWSWLTQVHINVYSKAYHPMVQKSLWCMVRCFWQKKLPRFWGHKIRIHIPSFLWSKKQSNVKNTENCALCACLMIRIRMKYQIDQSSFLLGSGSPSIPVECMCESYKLTRKSYQIETTQNKWLCN